jgi:cbb3-type cytochrome oxidase maturation protein
MSALYVLLGVSLSIAVGFLVVFIISARSGQFEDDYTPSIRMLSDDPKPETDSTKPENQPEV